MSSFDSTPQNTHVCLWVIWLWVILYLFVLTRVGCLYTFLPMHPDFTVCLIPPAQNRHVKAMKEWMNESLVQVSPLQLRAQENQSCVRLVLSPLCLVYLVRLTVNPVLLVFIVETQDSELRLDLVVMVCSCIITGFMLYSLSFSYYTTLSFGQATGVPLVRLWMQLCRVLQATSAHKVAQLQNHAHQEHTRTERNRQTVLSAYQVAAFSDFKKVHFIIF